MKCKALFITLVVGSYFSHGQSQANVWYFGLRAGVDFSSGQPVAITDGELNTDEGCVTICDNSGRLHFYTDGVSVWNKDHQVMPNGKGLLGSPSSTSSGVFIQHPTLKHLYYLFTVAAIADSSGFRYSLVDMKLDNGRGDVVADKKNIKLRSPVTEKLTSVLHRNGKDYWILVHDWNSDLFAAYLINENGLQPNPITSATGIQHHGSTLDTQGYMKLNPDGTNLAVAIEDSQVVEIFDFNNETGEINNPVRIMFPSNAYPYGIEFSPDGSLLYVSTAGFGEVYQFNLQAGSDEAIRNSSLLVGKSTLSQWIGALQIATDGRIYFTQYQQPFLGSIPNPNIIGAGCGFIQDAVALKGRVALLGLPTFSQNFFYKKENRKVEYFNEDKVVTGKSLVLKNILFDFGQFTLKSSSFSELDKVVHAMTTNTSFKLNVTGHSDNIGNKSQNIVLSANRAKAVADYLISKGIPATSISSAGFGSAFPVAGNDTEKGRAENRRVELVFK